MRVLNRARTRALMSSGSQRPKAPADHSRMATVLVSHDRGFCRASWRSRPTARGPAIPPKPWAMASNVATDHMQSKGRAARSGNGYFSGPNRMSALVGNTGRF
jgi:hypothetical protein